MTRPKSRDQAYPMRTTLTAVPVPPWLGNITEPWCQECSWAVRGGVLTVKYINRACRAHGKILQERRP